MIFNNNSKVPIVQAHNILKLNFLIFILHIISQK